MAESNNPGMAYLWKCLGGDPDIMKLFTAELPGEVYAQSTDPRTHSNTGSKARKPGGGKGKKKQQSGSGFGTNMVEASGMSERNACLAKKADNETHNIIISRRDAAKRKHDEILAKLRTRITDSKEMNQRIKAVKKHVDENPDSLNSFSYDYDDEEEIIDSQEDIIKDLLRSRNTFLHAQKEASQYESKSKL
jgi:hypothetical protein